jgi:hypothetical protein
LPRPAFEEHREYMIGSSLRAHAVVGLLRNTGSI